MKKRMISFIISMVLTVTMMVSLIVPVSAASLDTDVAIAQTQSIVNTEASTMKIFDFEDCKVYGDVNSTTAFIFYPGGNVSYKDYEPLLMAIAQKGYLCISVKMPFNYAIFNIPAATKFKNKYPNVENWYIGGHSLGGAMSAVYASYHANELTGLVLLAAYSTKDLTKKDIRVLSIYGSNDGVLNMDSYAKYRTNLPAGFTEKIIEGGNHGQFGNYGFQDGDNEATISALEQVDLAACYVDEFFSVN